jgi:hypothetical protein
VQALNHNDYYAVRQQRMARVNLEFAELDEQTVRSVTGMAH